MKEHVDTTRKIASMRQIHGAIRCLHDEQFECAITLAGAGEEMVPNSRKDEKPLVKILQERMPDDDPNLFRNWLKHPRGPDKARVTVMEVVLMITRAIHKFVWFYEESTDSFELFIDWAMLHGHLPRRITEKSAQTVVAATGSAQTAS
jgi:hypothetical protein